MNPPALLARARAVGISLRVEGGDLVLSADAPPDMELLHALKGEKGALLVLLRLEHEQACPPCRQRSIVAAEEQARAVAGLLAASRWPRL